MFQRTLQLKYAVHDKLTTMHRTVLNIAKNRQEIYFDFEPEDVQEEVWKKCGLFGCCVRECMKPTSLLISCDNE